MHLIFLLLPLLSCTNQSSAVLVQNTPPLVEAPAKVAKCRPTEYEQLAKWSLASGAELSVCKIGESYKLSETEFSGWINLFHKNGEAFNPLIADVKSELPSELYLFNVKRTDDSRIKVTRSIRSIMEEAGGEETPATEAFIECGKNGCRLGKETCINSKVNQVDSEAIQNLEGVRANKLKVSELGYYDIVVGKVLSSALAGNKRALALLSDKNAVRDLKLDGASAEIHADGMHAIEKLQSLGCLK